MTGQGIYTWASGDRYEGQWKDSDMNGKGTRYYANGNTYTGDWIDNKRTGQGIFAWANGDRYEGQWKDSNMNGKGIRYWANENTYTGDWIDNKRTGQGIFAWANGDRYKGQWRDDNMNGRGEDPSIIVNENRTAPSDNFYLFINSIKMNLIDFNIKPKTPHGTNKRPCDNDSPNDYIMDCAIIYDRSFTPYIIAVYQFGGREHEMDCIRHHSLLLGIFVVA
ncbi:unnamed protein product [Adineta steineri]|uniref:Uncharacterized protein n=2 Tax=Adineta steineri TaxID=433720 RepID=A0A819RQT4_9BILA|nr:unnamed protein product [Adineta steineri]